MPAPLFPLVGFALLDSLNVLNLGVTSAVVYDSRLSRRSPLPAGLSFIAGVFAATTTFGICAVLGLTIVTARIDAEVTPAVRYWGELVLGVLLIVVASISSSKGPRPPEWVFAKARRNPWLFGVVGAVVGFGQAGTSVPYLTSVTMIAAYQPLPVAWPVIVVAYCAAALIPASAVLALSFRSTMRARRAQRRVVRAISRYGPLVIRGLFLVLGAVLVVDALWHYEALF